MSGLLASIFSAGDRLKRKVNGLLDDPAGTLVQHVGLLNDKAGEFNKLHSEATQELVNAMRGGGNGLGPKSQQLAGKLADAYNPVGMVAFKGPQAEALETARKNAVKMLGLPENNTPMDRARAMGFDTDAYHATGADFGAFKPHPYRGAVSVAATPQGAIRGGLAGAADNTGTGASHVIPLKMRSEGVQGLRLPQNQVDFLKSLPDMATEEQVDTLMNKAPKGSYWSTYFHEVQNPDGSFVYMKKPEPKASFIEVQKTWRGADGFSLPNWGEEAWSSARQKEIGGKGWLQADEAGISASIVDPSILRSRFAAFDPARINENDLLGRINLPMLGLLGAGAGGAAYLTKEDR